ncbi:Helicase POLQ-like protein [Thelohanellus kitauei]|uniref:Helicase POLQ-like protein n=1 Tax=Thelohanellus kitauei TaxID=669202 RepID=A0A0C2MKC9_THEKT|nr:Helicase POLQ-like protein [Thelohanellus kitauei]
MSATIKNVEDLCAFLGATYYTSSQRPVALKEYICIGTDLYQINSSETNWNSTKKFQKSFNGVQINNSSNLGLLLHFVQELDSQHSCLIFCPTKKNCEVTCENLRKNLNIKTVERQNLLSALEYVTGGVCQILKRSIPHGIAYHHAGMADDERKTIEEGYLCGTINVLCCTSTLAAGVNLPAYRVIIKSPKIGISTLTNVYYRQMIGRAGRPGLSEHGESILMVQNSDKPLLDQLLVNDQICCSAITNINEEELANIILFLYEANASFEKETILNFFKRTLFYHQIAEEDTHKFLERLDNAFGILIDKNLVTEQNDSFKLTNIGMALNKSGLDIKTSQAVHQSLQNSMKNFVLSTDLHLVYICTPNEIEANINNFNDILRLISTLNQAELDLLHATGLSEGLIYKCIQNTSSFKINGDLKLLFNKWFFTLLFYQVYRGRSIWEVSAQFEISRGVVQHLSASTVSNAYTIARYTKEFKEFWQITLLLEEMAKKLSMVNNYEVMPLLEITSVKLARAKQLFKAGYKTVSDVANAKVNDMIANISHLSRRQAASMISSAKLLIREQVETLMEQADEILERCKFTDID